MCDTRNRWKFQMPRLMILVRVSEGGNLIPTAWRRSNNITLLCRDCPRGGFYRVIPCSYSRHCSCVDGYKLTSSVCRLPERWIATWLVGHVLDNSVQLLLSHRFWGGRSAVNNRLWLLNHSRITILFMCFAFLWCVLLPLFGCALHLVVFATGLVTLRYSKTCLNLYNAVAIRKNSLTGAMSPKDYASWVSHLLTSCPATICEIHHGILLLERNAVQIGISTFEMRFSRVHRKWFNSFRRECCQWRFSANVEVFHSCPWLMDNSLTSG